MKSYHTNIVAVYLVFRRAPDEVLLLRRFNTGFEDGKYSLVAGHVEVGETFTAAAVREAREEAGVVIDPTDLLFSYMLHRKSADGSERVDVFFTVEKWTGEIVNKEPAKCDDMSWFTFGQLPANTIPYIRNVLEAIRNKNFYGEYGWRLN